MKTQPMKHQSEDLEATWSKSGYAFFWEMGLGKSKVVIDTIQRLNQKKNLTHVLIISDKGSYLNWIKELQIHADFPYKLTVIRSGKKNQVIRQCSDDNDPGTTHLMLINTEAFSVKAAELFREIQSWLKHGFASMCVVDESTSIKSHNSNRSKAIHRIGQLFDYRRIMTGTPAAQSPLDLYGMFRFLMPELFGTSYYAYRSQYCVLEKTYLPNGRTFDKIVGYRNQDNLAALTAPHASRRTKVECLDLPEKIYKVHTYPMEKEQARLYRDITDTFVTQFRGKVVTTSSALTLVSVLRQLACGRLDQTTIPHGRTEALMSILRNHNGKALIWCAFRGDIEEIIPCLESEFGEGCAVMYHGDRNITEREDDLERFKHDPDCKYFVATTQTGGKGLTLVEADLVVYYSNGYSLEGRLQSEDRAHRIGQKNTVTYVDLELEDSIDTTILKILKEKKDRSEDLMYLLSEYLNLSVSEGQVLQTMPEIGTPAPSEQATELPAPR